MEYNQEYASRKVNKYSIRKFSVGLASIVVGSVIFYGQNVQAAEGQQNNVSMQQNNSADAQTPSSEVNDSAVSAVNVQRVSSESILTESNTGSEVKQLSAQVTSNANQPQTAQAPVENKNQVQDNTNVTKQSQQSSKSVLKQTQVEIKQVNAQTKQIDLFNYIEQNSKHLTENERQFYLRAIAREMPILTKDWQKIYDKNYSAVTNDVNTSEVGTQKVQKIKNITDSLQSLITNRDSDEYYTNLRNDNISKNLNHFTLNNNFEKTQDGEQTLKLGLSKNIVQITYPHNGKWLKWDHRFDHWGIRTNDSLNNKIKEVRLKYRWNGKSYDEVINRDKDGFYWFKEEAKHGFKAHLGGAVDFLVKLKKNAVLDKSKDAVWGYILSDAEHKNPMAIVNYAFKKFNLGQQNFDQNFNASTLATLKQDVTSKINDKIRGFSAQDTSKDYYLGQLSQVTESITTPEQYIEAIAKLIHINRRVTTALEEVRPSAPQHRTVNANTKDVNVLKYIEENSKYLSDEERKFFLRQVTRHSGFHSRDWNHIYRKDYDNISANVNSRTVGSSNVDSLNKLLTAMYDLIEGRNNDQLYKELTTDSASQNLNNTYTLDNNVTQNNGQQTVKIQVGKTTLQFSDYNNGAWWEWQKRFEQWGLRANESLNRKIDKVTAKYRWNGQEYEDVLVRDSKGFYWFKEDEKFADGKAKVGGEVNFLLTFKKDAVLDKANDKLWGYVISDSKDLETKAGANVGFGKINFDSVLSKFNSQAVTNIKQDLLNNIQTLAPVLTTVQENAEGFKTKLEAVNIDNLSEQQFEQVKSQLDNLTKEVAQSALKNSLLSVPSNKEHLSQYAKLSNDSYFLSFQSLNTDPVNSLNADGSVTLKPHGYLFYNVKTEKELAPGKRVNLTLVANNVDKNTKFEYGVLSENNTYIVGITQIPKTNDGRYKLQNFTIPQGAKKFALRLDNRQGTTDTHVKLFTLVPENSIQNKTENLLVVPDNFQHIGNFAKYNQDGQFLNFQALNTAPINSFNADGSLTLKPKGYLFYNLKAEGALAPGKQFNILVMTSQVDENTKLEYGFHDQKNKLGNTITAITKTSEGRYSIDNVTVPENVKDVALRLDNRTGSSDAIIQGVFIVPTKPTEV
ncbi:YSIRK-type signal peptide-containing protein [Staphylococcus durrellii]|uniref:YSIRK-type signal peptide-containing protein n=1 Tax=Staphylococcus durrellii TaxID=2781773 RepID=UPI00189F6D68|nr:YSIRK-type signal peptide-containing protein [Staphylococcus durrellii]MBF7016769.1 YSIRK-type signal peptide-containing protein [Staphylococcus durrellii]